MKSIKLRYWIISAISVFSVFISCKKDIAVTSVSLDKDIIILSVGSTETLKVEVLPTNSDIKSVTFESSNPNFATVSSSGLVTAISIGQTIIEVRTNDGGKTARCTIIVVSRGVWTQKADFPGGYRWDAVTFSIGNKGYIGTGYSRHGDWIETYYEDFWEYDPIENIWTQKADFAGGKRVYAIGFSIGNKGYIGTGSDSWWADGNYFRDFWEYDPVSNIWTQKANLRDGRWNYFSFSIGNIGYVGQSDYKSYNNFWGYDPNSNIWTKKADFAGIERGETVSFSISNKGYIGTGRSYGYCRNDFWEYDQISNIWTQKADFAGGARTSSSGFSIGEKGYIGAGCFFDGKSEQFFEYKDFWEYDPVYNIWTQKEDFSGGSREIALSFSIGNKGYIGAGINSRNSMKDFWEFNP